MIRTRRALVDAFNHLVLVARKGDIRVAEVVAKANVGRSTFYDHYSGTSALQLEALRGPFSRLADAASGTGNETSLTPILAHFWEFRQRGRKTFGESSQRLLAEMVEERLSGLALRIPAKLAARQLAAAAHSPLVAWITGAAPCSPAQLAHAICRAGEAQLEALRLEFGETPA